MRPIGLYIHWPFCARICPYCDFTVAKNRAVDPEGWARAFTDDLSRMVELTERRPLTSLYFGGGTPSLMPLDVMEAVITRAEELMGLAPGCEITLEANPDDKEQFADYRAVGANRLSLGVQSFRDDELQFLGRNHNADEARAAVKMAVGTFDRVSLDLIYALPDQPLSDWRATLKEAAGYGAGHLSLYQLTIEPETAFGRRAGRGQLRPMPDDDAAELYEATQLFTDEVGLPAYEVSNHARRGEGAKHNSLYWADADWLAIGPGAHGRIGPPERRLATAGVTQAVQYPALSRDERIATELLSLKDHRLEVLSAGLRPVAGFDLDRLGGDAEAVVVAARPLVEMGLLELRPGRLAATSRGRLLLDHIALELSAGVTGS